jgi:hypothetical protein
MNIILCLAWAGNRTERHILLRKQKKVAGTQGGKNTGFLGGIFEGKMARRIRDNINMQSETFFSHPKEPETPNRSRIFHSAKASAEFRDDSLVFRRAATERNRKDGPKAIWFLREIFVQRQGREKKGTFADGRRRVILKDSP